jgi:hypothetical protein
VRVIRTAAAARSSADCSADDAAASADGNIAYKVHHHWHASTGYCNDEAQHSTAQHSTAQHSTAQHSTLHYYAFAIIRSTWTQNRPELPIKLGLF